MNPGRILVTVNGKTLVVNDDKSFELLLELVERLETLDSIRSGLEDMRAGRSDPWMNSLRCFDGSSRSPRIET
jgi:hypothetical protein